MKGLQYCSIAVLLTRLLSFTGQSRLLFPTSASSSLTPRHHPVHSIISLLSAGPSGTWRLQPHQASTDRLTSPPLKSSRPPGPGLSLTPEHLTAFLILKRPPDSTLCLLAVPLSLNPCTAPLTTVLCSSDPLCHNLHPARLKPPVGGVFRESLCDTVPSDG